MRRTGSGGGAYSPAALGLPVAAGLLLVLLLGLSASGACAETVSARARAGERVLKGEELFRAGRFEDAQVEFRAAASAAPRWVVPQYYLAYVDYKLGNFPAAREGFEKALSLDPGDGWSRYMLGLTLAQLGNLETAQTQLEIILGMKPDMELKQTTLSTLEELRRFAVPAPPKPAPWALSASAAVAVDTNPAYLADRVVPDSPGTAVDALLRGAAEYRRPLSRNLRLFAGGEVYEQAILANRQDADWTAASLWLGVSRPGKRVSAQAEYAYGYSVFGGDPYLGVHAFSSAVEFREASWTASRIETTVALRNAQRSTFGYLDSQGLSFAVGQVVSLYGGDLVASLLYAVVRDWADDFSQRFSLLEGSDATRNVYKTNYSFLGHGPLVSVRARLPYALRLSFQLGYLWKDFDDPDILVSTGTTNLPVIRSKSRSDTRLTVDATLWRRLKNRWSLFLSFSSLDNASTLGDGADDFVDRNYSRRMVSVGIGYAFP